MKEGTDRRINSRGGRQTDTNNERGDGRTDINSRRGRQTDRPTMRRADRQTDNERGRRTGGYKQTEVGR